MTTKPILVTGGAGFIGSNFVRYLLAADPDAQIINLDALTYAGTLSNLNNLPYSKRHHFIEGDILNREKVSEILRDYQIKTIVHFAAETHVDRSIVGPDKFISTNVDGTFNILEAARDVWLRGDPETYGQYRFHHISTDEVFGSLDPGQEAFSEKTPYQPNSPYAASKAASDHLVRAYHQTYDLPITITNCSNNYGPYQFPEKLIPLVILNAMENKPIPIYGDGQQIRDWLYVEDHCEAIFQVLEKGKPGETYNIGGDNQPTNLEIVEMICGILDGKVPEPKNKSHKSLIQFVSDRPGHDRRYAINLNKINKSTGWEPRYSLEEGLDKTIKWYLDNQEWVEEIKRNKSLQKWNIVNYQERGAKS